MLTTLKKDYRVDEKRIYATGHSNGGGFTYLLWAARGDVFAAVAPCAAAAPRSAPLAATPGAETSRFSGMVIGMATQKITVTLDEDQVKEIRALVAARQAANVSAFVQHAVGVALHDAAGWKAMLADALRQTGGPLTKDERAWADAFLSPRERKRGPKKGRAA